MNFIKYKQKALNNNLPLDIRIYAIKNSMTHLSFAIRLQFQTCEFTYTQLKDNIFKKFDITETLIHKEKISDIVEEIDKINKAFSAYNIEYAKYRKRKKLNGQRQVSNKDFKFLKMLENKLIEVSLR